MKDSVFTCIAVVTRASLRDPMYGGVGSWIPLQVKRKLYFQVYKRWFESWRLSILVWIKVSQKNCRTEHWRNKPSTSYRILFLA